MSGMTSYQAILLGAQAAGMGANLYAAYNQKKSAKYAIETERGELGLRRSQEELSFAESNLESLRELQEVLASQRAIMGARGQMPGVGSSLAAANKAIAAQGSDERARKLTKDFRNAQLDSMNRLLNIKKSGIRAGFGASLIEGGLNAINLNTTIGKYLQTGKQTSTTTKTTKKGNFITKNQTPYSKFDLKGSIYG